MQNGFKEMYRLSQEKYAPNNKNKYVIKNIIPKANTVSVVALYE